MHPRAKNRSQACSDKSDSVAASGQCRFQNPVSGGQLRFSCCGDRLKKAVNAWVKTGRRLYLLAAQPHVIFTHRRHHDILCDYRSEAVLRSPI